MDWIKKCFYLYLRYYLAVKKVEVACFKIVFMKLGNYAKCKITQEVEDSYQMLTRAND